MPEDKIPQEVLDGLTEGLKNMFEERQNRPNQYVVAYYRMDDSLIGYHLSTFNQITDDILKAKRYSGEDPTEQLKIIRKNLDYTLDMTPERAEKVFLGESNLRIKEKYFPGLKKEDIYIDVIPLEEGTPKQKFGFKIIN